VIKGTKGTLLKSYETAKKTFILNFTLYNKTVADKGSPAFLNSTKTAEDCWEGYQRLAASSE
jgi:hypothetical protein